MGLIRNILAPGSDKYYSYDKVDATNADYRMVIGERSDGKTFGIWEKIIKTYAETGRQSVYLRRYDFDLTGARAKKAISDMEEHRMVEKYTGKAWTNIYYYAGAWYFCKYKDKKDKKGNIKEGERQRIVADEPFCYGMALNSDQHDKSTGGYPKVKIICFDEFMVRSTSTMGYLVEEFVRFMNTLKTIIRDKKDCVIYMLGNTVSRYCPYFREMGLTNIKKQQQGSIDLYQMGDSGLTVAVEYCGERKKNKEINRYYAFDNPRLKMITEGKWEIDVHPHLPCRYRDKDVLFSFFIKFDGELLKCDIILKENNYFIFCMPKTTPIKDPDHDVVFADSYDPRPNWGTSIFSGGRKIDTAIRRLLSGGHVFFADNETGEVFYNYLNWCRNGRR